MAETPNADSSPRSESPFGRLRKHELYWRDRQLWLERSLLTDSMKVDETKGKPIGRSNGATSTLDRLESRRLQTLIKQRENLEKDMAQLEAELKTLLS